MRETMKMMGLSQWTLWTTWFIKQFLFLLIPIIVVTILLKVWECMRLVVLSLNVVVDIFMYKVIHIL